ncbi:hypothetical protein QN277_019718 [Acacia crassicarpa]|uniref:AAA+ ATPase domain-containing protein n=1 Tax=Acacia crassicarpa TaxID=499986 RepID=A0AAE1MMI0_9FABA|nr:hypothetical protein QN277_019718 [Acacia crassicarpa]
MQRREEAKLHEYANGIESRVESEYVKAIVENVYSIILDMEDLLVPQHPVGVGNRVQEVIAMLQNHQSEDVIMVGIWGMAGIGKTTIAKAICNKIGQRFESRSFLSNIREVWHEKWGDVHLQNQLLYDICKTKGMKINDVDLGKSELSKRLCHKKVLVVLDDVDKLAQLKALVGSRDWFQRGSTIIITTRNKRLLSEMDCHVYMVKNLNEEESIELFSWHAFKQESLEEDFIKLSKDIVAYSEGLPFALEVLGYYVYEREMKQWMSVLERFKMTPDHQVLRKLQISFDSLDDNEKEIFLNIVLFYIGEDMNDVIQKLDARGCHASIGMRGLVDKSLVTIDDNKKIRMHNLLQLMGREIMRKSSQNEFLNSGTLWFYEDV